MVESSKLAVAVDSSHHQSLLSNDDKNGIDKTYLAVVHIDLYGCVELETPTSRLSQK